MDYQEALYCVILPNKPHSVDDDGREIKYCPWCGNWYTLDRFLKKGAGRSPDGLRLTCKNCNKAGEFTKYRKTFRRWDDVNLCWKEKERVYDEQRD